MRENIGGQALIEGVMMKSPSLVAYSCRAPDGKIISKTREFVSLTKTSKILGLPIIRGFVSLLEIMVVGMQALTWSAGVQDNKEKSKLSFIELFFTFFVSIFAVVGLFIILPYYASFLFVDKVGFAFNLVDGILRLVVFLIYIYVISLMKDIYRVFQYHGAEHMAVHCHESGKKLTVNNVRRFSTLHPRCGTALIVLVIAVSIILFSVIKSDFWYMNLLYRIILIPLIAGISYEITKFCSKNNNIFFKIILAPGLWTQKITTKIPDDSQIEVAIVSLKNVLK